MSVGMKILPLFLTVSLVGEFQAVAAEEATTKVVSTQTIRRKVLCGYQGWFRCPGDLAKVGWHHWSRDGARIAPNLLSFEMWPDLSEFDQDEKYPAPGFEYPDGQPASLFSSANHKTVRRHFEWMKQYGIDGVFLQHFLVDLPGGPAESHYGSRRLVMEHVVQAANETGRVWALAYDIAGLPGDRVFDVLTADWKRQVDSGTTSGPRYLHEDQRPVVQIWGFYRNQTHNAMNPELAHRLIDFFSAPGPYRAFLIGGGDWDWRKDEGWRGFVHRFDGYSPWNVGNYRVDQQGVRHASTDWWEADRRECEQHHVLWLPVVYPGFSWDNLQRKQPGTSIIPRRKGEFLWDQFDRLAQLGVQEACVAMFDEVDEGTAIFKVTNTPPVGAHFVTFEGLPSDWYLRLTGAGTRLLRGEIPRSRAIPIRP